MRCEICGGATKCPKGFYSRIEPLKDSDYVFVAKSGTVPSGYSQTHSVRGGGYFLHPDCDNVGAMQMRRIRAHYPDAVLQWVGQCRYAFRGYRG